MIKKKYLAVFGTRPEAIKMAPLVKMFKLNSKHEIRVCISAQHREMLDQVLNFFNIEVNYDLDIMKPNQNLYSLTADIMVGLKPILEEYKPDYVFVHGDTTTTMATSIAAFYSGSKVCHVEAGLRTYNMLSPFPEEMNRTITGQVADFHFAPTESAKRNLLKENIPEQNIVVTGNTVIDALLDGIGTVNNKTYLNESIERLKEVIKPDRRLVLITGHRRENHGQGFKDICSAIEKLAQTHKEVDFVYPVHLNPNVKDIVFERLSGIENVHLIEPLSYPSFIWIMNRSYIILTDSGGVQEEAPSLGKPVLVMRNNTERPEAVEAGTVKLVGTNTELIVQEVTRLLENTSAYAKMSSVENPYGDGRACERILKFLEK